jgi:HD-like signal output (HDOD) protein/CheY-like chemotaxis protein
MTAAMAFVEPELVATRPTILFVDDDEGVRFGLRTALRRLRREIDFAFAASGAEALEFLDRQPVDLIVTDMRMPGMSGAELLHRVRIEHPSVVRYVLSGEADEGMVLHAMPVVHRWLSKPCDRDRLTDALSDALRYRDALVDNHLVDAVVGATTLPSPPGRYLEMLELVNDPDVALDELAAVAERDPALAAKVLQLANSAFASPYAVADVRGAVARVGIDAFAQLALSAELVRALRPTESIPGFDLPALERHSARVGAAAARLAKPDERSVAGVAGLLSHVGLLLEAALLPDRLRVAHEAAEAWSCSLVAAERRLSGVGHPELAGHLLSIWGLPVGVVLAVAGSHDHPPADSVVPLSVPDAVRAGRLVAQAMSEDVRSAPHIDEVPDDLALSVARWCDLARPGGHR